MTRILDYVDEIIGGKRRRRATRFIGLLLLVMAYPSRSLAQGSVDLWRQAELSLAPDSLAAVTRPSIPKLNLAGSEVAFQREDNLQVWTVRPDGNLGKLLWDFAAAFPKGSFYDFEWAGDQLALSKTDRNQRTGDWFFQSEEERLATSRFAGDTVLLDPVTGVMHPLLKAAFRTIAVSPDAQFMVACEWTMGDDTALGMEFYALKGGMAVPLGTFRQPGWGQLSRRDLSPPVFLGWDSSDSGVYIVPPNPDNADGTMFESYRSRVLYVDRQGHGSEITKPNEAVADSKSLTVPLGESEAGPGLRVADTIYDQVFGVGRLTPVGIVPEISWDQFLSPLGGKLKRPLLVGLTKNGRYAVFQDWPLPKPGQSLLGVKGAVWLVDVKGNRCRKLGDYGLIQFAGGWGGDKLVIEASGVEGKLETLRTGVIRIPEADLPFTVDAPGDWESGPIAPGASPTVVAVEKLISSPALKLPPGTQVALTDQPDSSLLGQYPTGTVYLHLLTPSGVWRTDTYLAYDPKANRLLGFQFPASAGPFPDQRLSDDQLRQTAVDFATANQGAGAPGDTVTPRETTQFSSPGARYYEIRLNRAGALLPAQAEVELSEVDGRIIAYRELPPVPVTVVPATVTADQTHQIATTNLVRLNSKYEPVSWLLTSQEFDSVLGNLQQVWTVVAGVARKTDPTHQVRVLYHWYIDPLSGKVLLSERLPEDQKPLYQPPVPDGQAVGPTRDSAPRWSPEGTRVAFLSDRPRPGQPAWLEGRRPGLYAVDTGTLQVTPLAPRADTPAIWSPSGRFVAFETYEANSPAEPHVYDLQSNQEEDIPDPVADGTEQQLYGWGPGDQLYLGRIAMTAVTIQLYKWDPVAKTLALAVPDWAPEPATPREFLAWSLSPDQRRLLLAWEEAPNLAPARDKDGEILELNPSQLAAKPHVLTTNLSRIDELQWTPDGLLVHTDAGDSLLEAKPGAVPPAGNDPQVGPQGQIVDSEEPGNDGTALLFVRKTPAGTAAALTKAVAIVKPVAAVAP